MIDISVIIPTRNRAALLDATLRSIVGQTFPSDKYEVIVVDNGSTDQTKAIVERFQQNIKNLHYAFSDKPGLHEGRHAGFRVAAGNILTFADDDITALPTWLAGIFDSFKNPMVGLTGGKNIPEYETPCPSWIDPLWDAHAHGKYMTYFSLLDLGDTAIEIDPRFVFGCNFSIRKNLLERAKGFHPDGMPEALLKFRGDGETYVAEKVKQLGFITWYNPDASVYHKVSTSRMTMEYLKKRAFAEGITSSYSDVRRIRSGDTSNNMLSKMASTLRGVRASLFRSSVRKDLRRSFEEGYNFHQQEMKKDPALREWVLRENYLND